MPPSRAPVQRDSATAALARRACACLAAGAAVLLQLGGRKQRMPGPAAAQPAARGGSGPQQRAPERPVARPAGGAPAHGAPATVAQRKSKYAYVHWDILSKPGAKGWFGALQASTTLLTPAYATEEEAARAVDRCATRALLQGASMQGRPPTSLAVRAQRRFLYKVRGPEACNFPVTPQLAAELDALTVEQITQRLRCEGVCAPALPPCPVVEALGTKVTSSTTRALPRSLPKGETHGNKNSRFKGVRFIGALRKWEASVFIKQQGPSKPVFLGYHATEEQAAERVSAAAYILGDR